MTEGPAPVFSALRSIAFLLFQLVVTPLYALAMVATFWLPPVPRYRIAAHWCWLNLVGVRALCGIRWRVDGLANIPADTFDLDGDTNVAEPLPFDQRGTGFTRAPWATCEKLVRMKDMPMAESIGARRNECRSGR